MILSASPIILRGGQPDHMQTVQSRRMPVFVAKKSQYRNRQQQERVADRHRARRRWRSRNFNIGITIVRVGPEPSQWRDTIIWKRFSPWRLARNKSPGLVLSGEGKAGADPETYPQGGARGYCTIKGQQTNMQPAAGRQHASRQCARSSKLRSRRETTLLSENHLNQI